MYFKAFLWRKHKLKIYTYTHTHSAPQCNNSHHRRQRHLQTVLFAILIIQHRLWQ